MKIKRYLISTQRLFDELPFFRVRDLKNKEKNKSVNYWEGHTKAVAELVHYLKNYERKKMTKTFYIITAKQDKHLRSRLAMFYEEEFAEEYLDYLKDNDDLGVDYFIRKIEVKEI